MRKLMAFLLAFTLVFSLVSVPASATEEALDGTILKTIDIDSLDPSVNYLYEDTKLGASTFSNVTFSSGNYTINSGYVGAVDTSTNTIYKTYPLAAKSGAQNIQDAYALGDGTYDLIIGSSLGETYPGTANSKTGVIHTGQPFKGAYLKQVADPVDPSNKVLEFNFGQTGNNAIAANGDAGTYNALITRLYFGSSTSMLESSGNTYDVTDDEGNTTTYTTFNKIKSGIMAYEYKIYVPENSAKYMKSGGYVNLGGIITKGTSGYNITYDVSKYNNSTGMLVNTIKYGSDGKSSLSYSMALGEWHTVKQVVMVDDTVDSADKLKTYYPTAMTFLDGELVFKGQARDCLAESSGNYVKCGQIRFALAPEAASTYADQSINYNVYFDDLKQYWVTNKLTVSDLESAYADFDPSEDAIEINYSTYPDTAALEEAVTVKRNGIVDESVTAVAEDKGNGNVALSFDGLNTSRAVTYSVEISKFTDIYGTVAEGTSFTVTTPASEVTAEEQLNSIVSHDFEEYDVSTASNWIGTDDDGNAVDNSPAGWVISYPRTSDTDTVQVVADPLASGRGNVLRHATTSTTATTTVSTKNGTATSNRNMSELRMLLDEKATELTDDVVLRPYEDERTQGRRIVVKYDVYVPASARNTSNSILATPRLRNGYTVYDGNGDELTQSSSAILWYARSMNSSGYVKPYSSNLGGWNLSKSRVSGWDNRHSGVYETRNLPTGSWQTVTYVIDTSYAPDTTYARGNARYRVYVGNDATLPSVTSWRYVNVNEDGSYDTSAEFKKDVTGDKEKLYDLWSTELLKLGAGEGGWGGAFKGFFTLASYLTAESGKTAEVYYDNIEVFAPELFNISLVPGNYDEFDVARKTVEYEFTTMVDSNMAEFVSLEDSDGNTIENALTVTFADDKRGMSVKINSTAVEAEKTYTIVIDPQFHDIYMQGFDNEYENIWTSTYYKTDVTIADVEYFNATVSDTEIANFYEGADRNIVITLNQETALTDDTISTAFEVKDAEGNEVTGWTASLSTDKKVITISLSTLDATKAFPYTLTSTDTLVNDLGETLPQSVSVKISAANGIYTIFDETFENFTENVEWKSNLDDSNWVTSSNTGVGENTWKYVNSNGNDTNSVMVVNETIGDRTGKFLKYTSGKDGTTPYILRNSNGDTGISFLDSGSDYYGKKLVYQVDVYYDGFTTTNGNASTFLNFNNNASTRGEGTFARLSGSNGLTVSSGVWGDKDYLRRTTLNLNDGWHTVTAVVDQTGTNPEINYQNVRYYLDGEPVLVPPYTSGAFDSTYYMSNENQNASALTPSFGTFFGTAFGGLSEGCSFYIDNLKAYAIDGVAFNVENIEFNKATGAITVEFNSVIDNEFLNYISIEDMDGNVISGGIKSIIGDGKTLEISGIDEPDFELFTEYKLVIGGLFRDIYFNEFNCYNAYEYEFITARSGNFAVANEPVAVIGTDSLTTTVEIVNKTSSATSFVMAVAVYDGYKLLGVKTASISLDALSSTSQDFALEGDYSTATGVKIHFWDSVSGMNAMSTPEPVTVSE